jgi:hypothetical protein
MTTWNTCRCGNPTGKDGTCCCSYCEGYADGEESATPQKSLYRIRFRPPSRKPRILYATEYTENEIEAAELAIDYWITTGDVAFAPEDGDAEFLVEVGRRSGPTVLQPEEWTAVQVTCTVSIKARIPEDTGD